MSDGEDRGGLTELQWLQLDVDVLQKQHAEVNSCDKTSAACTRICQSIKNAEASDGFLLRDHGTSGGFEPNQFHAAGPGGDGGCCVIQ
jgi:hypothetical protein